MRDRDDDNEPDLRAVPEYPKTVTAAGIIWIVFGCLALLNILVVVALLAAQVKAAGAACLVPVLGLVALFGGAFIFVGVQSVKGTARDTLGNGIGSLIFGLIYVITLGAQASNGDVIGPALGLLPTLGLLVAGVLALVGRGGYKAWRLATRATRDKGYGRVQQAQRALLRLGRQRFGPPSPEDKEDLLAITNLDRLERMTDAILTVDSWDELFTAARRRRTEDRPE